MANINVSAAGPSIIREFITGGNPALANLRPGDSLNAEVVSNGRDGMALLLPDGSQVSVASENGRELQLGETLRLTVTGRTAGSVIAELSQGAPRQAGPTLQALGIEQTPVNLTLADALRNGGITVTKDNMTQLAETLNAHPALTPDKAAFMLQNKIPVTPRNIASFEAFSRRESVIGGTLVKLMGILSEAEGAAPPAPAAQADSVFQEGRQQANAPVPIPVPADAEVMPGTREPAVAPQQTPAPQFSPAGPERLPAPTGAETAPSQAAALAVETPELLSQQTPANAAPREAAPLGTLSESAERPPQSEAQPVLQGLNPGETAQTDTQKAAAERSPGGAVRTDGGETSKTPDNIPRDTASPVTAQLQAREEDGLLAKVNNLFRKIDRSRANMLHRELDAPKLMRELSVVLHELEEKAQTMTGSAREQLTQVTRELETSLKFISQLNNFTAFVQLPVNINDVRTTADLYVFNDGKAKKIDPENATLFLSLATVNAGRIETFVKVIGKNVECDFSLESEESAKLLRGELPSLLKLLDAQGFKLQRTSSGVRTEPADVLEVREEHKKLASKYRFNTVV